MAKDAVIQPGDATRYLGEDTIRTFAQLKARTDPDGLLSSNLRTPRVRGRARAAGAGNVPRRLARCDQSFASTLASVIPESSVLASVPRVVARALRRFQAARLVAEAAALVERRELHGVEALVKGTHRAGVAHLAAQVRSSLAAEIVVQLVMTSATKLLHDAFTQTPAGRARELLIELGARRRTRVGVFLRRRIEQRAGARVASSRRIAADHRHRRVARIVVIAVGERRGDPGARRARPEARRHQAGDDGKSSKCPTEAYIRWRCHVVQR